MVHPNAPRARMAARARRMLAEIQSQESGSHRRARHVEDIVSDGGKFVARVRFTGTHRGDFMGMPATGKSVDVNLIDIHLIGEDGLVHEHAVPAQLAPLDWGSPPGVARAAVDGLVVHPKPRRARFRAAASPLRATTVIASPVWPPHDGATTTGSPLRVRVERRTGLVSSP